MKKRTFLNLLPAAAITPLTGWAADQPLTNWAGNLTYSSTNVHECHSVDEVRAFLKSQKKTKALGTRHCFSNIADSRNGFVSLKPMQQIAVDPKARTVTVEAGVTYGKLSPELDAKGFALHNLASLPHIGIAGACSTATHGSGEKNGNLATAASAIEFVTAGGDVVKLSRKADGEAFRAAVVGLGALGVITRVTLDIQPRYSMRQYVYENLPLDQMRSHFDAIQSSGYSVSLFTGWQKKRVNEVWIKTRVEDKFGAPREFFGAKLAGKDLHPIAELSAENCTEQKGIEGPWYERLPHFRMGFTPSAGKELQSEFFVPRRNAVDAILAVERLGSQIFPHLLISEIRTIAADDLWMSPCYQRPSVAIHFTWKQDWPAVRRLLPVIEKELSPFEPRPHWGKLFTISPAVLRSRYPKLQDFLQTANRYDPNGMFRNEYVDTNLFAH